MRVLIIEDEARIARRLERLTRDFFGEQLHYLAVRDSVTEGQHLLRQQSFDLILLDLNLNGEDGFQVLQTLAAEACQVIIVSAYAEKAITAFAYGVLDFVPKPFDQSRLNQAFLRLTTRPPAAGTSVRFLAVKTRGQLALVPIEDVRYVKGAGIYAELHLRDGKTALHDKSLDALERLLPGTFVRIHKSYLVALPEAATIRLGEGSRYQLVLHGGETLPIGRTRYAALKRRLMG